MIYGHLLDEAPQKTYCELFPIDLTANLEEVANAV